jgi:hypothetical protein
MVMKVDPQPIPTPAERLWRRLFFVMSAVMGALALVDLEAGRMAHALGDAGVVCLMLSLMTQFSFVRAMVMASQNSKPREELLRDVERIRAANPWAERLSSTGWLLLLASLMLRAFGLA